jgi:mono/diheme cytochrome c family protein
MALAQEKPPAGSKTGGAEVFKANCVLCHGEDGHAQTALGKQLGAHDLHSAAVQKKTDTELKNVITHGQKSMPPFAGQLSPAQVGQVVAYIRELGKKR